jgi:AraC-like DNA-binding protein
LLGIQSTKEDAADGIQILPIYCLFLSSTRILCTDQRIGGTLDLEEQQRILMAKNRTEDVISQSELSELRADLVRRISAHVHVEGPVATDVPGLTISRRSALSECYSAAYEPELVVCVQGEKRITVGGTTHICDGNTFLLTSIDLPVVGQITKASKEEPFLAMALKLEMPVVREILSQEEFLAPEVSFGVRGMAVGKTPAEMLGACSRLLGLLETPMDIPFLSSLMQREILYRLLRGPLGKHLRAIATLGEQSNRTAKAVGWLKANFDKPLRVEELASIAQMGVSTLHHHFRSLTAMSPLQYQKRLRLHAARVRMLTGGLDAASAAFEVGYESASQFNREYSRLFGQPPMRDVKSRRVAGIAGGESLEAY